MHGFTIIAAHQHSKPKSHNDYKHGNY